MRALCSATPRADGRRSERGSALIIAILVTVILTLLGISFLLLAQTENQIAQNEKRAAQALYVAEAGARAVKRWFDAPGTALRFPDATVVDRSLRQIIDENDPYGAPLATTPLYKESVDLDGDGADDLFDRPYRGSWLHALLGSPAGPDLRIDEATAGTFLEDLSRTLLGNFPGEGGGVFARISRIDVFAPPYVRRGAGWGRFGMGTIRVVGRIYQPTATGVEVIAEHRVETVLSETPYYGPHGPLHSCGDTTWTGGVGVRWGTLSSVGRTRLSPLAPYVPGAETARSIPRGLPAAPRIDPVWNTSDATEFATFKGNVEGQTIDDPWFRVLSGGGIVGAPTGDPQPFDDPPTLTAADHSNLLQLQPMVVCPPYDYELWRTIATSGERGVEYYAWDGTGFRKDGVGASRSFHQITDGAQGLFFFDTVDGRPPTDADADGVYDNLTPPITVAGPARDWSFHGMVYLNAESFAVEDVRGTPTAVAPPGEPYQDRDLDGVHDAGEGWINLVYPTTPATIDTFVANANAPGTPVRETRGPDIAGLDVSFHGIFFTNGSFEATGRGTFYGTVIARQGVTQTPADGSMPTPTIYWDDSIVTGWPPPGWGLPRVVATAWNLEP